MSDALEFVRNSSMAGEEVADMVDTLETRIEELEREVKRLSKQSANRLIGLCKCGLEREALQADNAHLRGVMMPLVLHRHTTNDSEYRAAEKALAATPEQSLARIRNQRVEDVAVMVKNDGWLYLAEAIRAMKEPE